MNWKTSLVVWRRTDPVHSQLFPSLNISYYISQVIPAVNLSSCAQYTLLNTHTRTHILKWEEDSGFTGTMKGGDGGSQQWQWCQDSCPHAIQWPNRRFSALHNPRLECIRRDGDTEYNTGHVSTVALHSYTEKSHSFLLVCYNTLWRVCDWVDL